jgi:hypothetical protein
VALFHLSVEIVGGLVFGALNPLEHRVFQCLTLALGGAYWLMRERDDPPLPTR